MKTIVRNCETCGVAFDAPLKEVNRGNGRFCTLNCVRHKNRKSKLIPNCKCAQCGMVVYRNKSKQTGSKSGLYFCNRVCKEQAQRLGGIREIMPPHYGTAKEDYREKFDNEQLKCYRCGYSEFSCAVDIHHIDKDRSNNDKGNLIPLCACCHRSLHFNKWKLQLGVWPDWDAPRLQRVL